MTTDPGPAPDERRSIAERAHRSAGAPDAASDPGAAAKPPAEWVSGDEPATAAQLSYLETLAHEVGEPVPSGLSKAAASELIDELRQRSPRVRD